MRNNGTVAGERDEDGSIKGAVTGTMYKPGDSVHPSDIKIVIEDGRRKAHFKAAEDVR